MQFEKFKEYNFKKKGIIIFTVFCIFLIAGVFLYSSFALFETTENFHLIEGDLKSPGDLYFAYYIDDQITTDIPQKNSGYTMSFKSSCTNGVTILWDNESWQAKLNYSDYKNETHTRVKCNLYFEKRTFENSVVSCGKLGGTATHCMLQNAYLDTTNLMNDDTVDNNLRYVGSNPNNYVTFNNELWRIVGVMNNVDDGSGNFSSLLKIIRDESIGEYSWDSSPETINQGLGVNEWSVSDIKVLLNNSYYNSLENQTCYQGEKNTTVSCSFVTNGLKNSQDLIETVVWYTGSNDNTSFTYREILTSQFYSYERGDVVGKQCSSGIYCNDTVTRTTRWTGNVGFLYPSDYGYATGGEERLQCLNNYLYIWEEMPSCSSNNWLSKNVNYWLITPRRDSTLPSASFCVSKNGAVQGGYAKNVNSVFPAVYLKSSLRIVSGGGTLLDPFVLDI